MKPYKVIDPIAERHIVVLHEGQELQLLVTDPKQAVNVSATFLKIASVEVSDQGKLFKIETTSDVQEHAYLSTHFLGEVIVGTDASLVVYLQHSRCQRKDIVTVVNPYNEAVRIRPFNTIEFMYCSDYNRGLRWNWEPKIDIDIEEVNYQTSFSAVPPKVVSQNMFCPHPRNFFTGNMVVHHFWFRMSKGLLAALQTIPEKNLFIGRLSVEGHNASEDYDDCYLDVYCDLVPKWRSKTVDFLANKHSTVMPYNGNNTAKNYTNYSNNYKSHRGVTTKNVKTMMDVKFLTMQTETLFKGCKFLEVTDEHLSGKKKLEHPEEKDYEANSYCCWI